MIKKSISVFFPCYNDSKSIKKLVDKAFLVIKEVTSTYEVIVIDDGSTDKSKEVLLELKKKYKKLKLVFHKKNLGYGGALRRGFRESKYEWVFYTDGDGQYDVSEIPILVSLIGEDTNFINGIKIARRDPTYRIFVGNIYSFVARWLFWLPILDVDCDFRLIKGSLLKKLKLKSSSGSICVELVKKAQRAGAKFKQVSIHHFERPHGKSQFFQTKHLLTTFSELFNLWFNLMVIDKA